MSATSNPALLSCAACLGLFAQRMAYGAYYTAGETPRAPRGTELAKMQCFGLRGCFWGDAHAGVSCQVQLGDPSPCGRLLPTTSQRSQSCQVQLVVPSNKLIGWSGLNGHDAVWCGRYIAADRK